MASSEQPTIIGYWLVVWRRRWLILAIAATATTLGFALGNLQPRIYTATASILTPREGPAPSMAMSLGAILGGAEGRGGMGGGTMPSISLGLPSMSTNQDMFTALLKSRTMRERVVAVLAERWGASVGGLVGDVNIDMRDRGVIRVTAEARDPKLAAEVANEYFEVLDRMLEHNATSTGKRQERYLAAQLDRAAKEVELAENALLKFQSENRMLGASTDAGSRGTADAAGMLRGSIMALELQREVMRMRYTDQHQAIREMERQIAEMKKQYSKNLFGEPMDLPSESPGGRGVRKEFFVAAAKMTPVQFAYLRLYRNLKIQEAFYAGALQGLEQVKYSDATNQPHVEVLDGARTPSKPSRPNLMLIVFAAAVGGLTVGIVVAYGDEYLGRLRREYRRTATGSVRQPVRPSTV